MRTLPTSLLMLLASLLAGPARAEDDPLASPVGRWTTIDDATGKPKSIVSIWEEAGLLFGKVEEILDPKPDDPDPRCVKCSGELKDRPIVGLRILWDFRRDGDRWAGGRILDPENGKIYSCNLGLSDGGRKLRVHGFIGIPLLGRTQTWLRAEGGA